MGGLAAVAGKVGEQVVFRYAAIGVANNGVASFVAEHPEPVVLVESVFAMGAKVEPFCSEQTTVAKCEEILLACTVE